MHWRAHKAFCLRETLPLTPLRLSGNVKRMITISSGAMFAQAYYYSYPYALLRVRSKA